MGQITTQSKAVVGTVHEYSYKKSAFEFNGSNPSHVAKNVVLFIGGLCDGLLTVHYLPTLAAKVSTIENDGDWVLVQGILSSSYLGWGQSSLEKDNKEIGQIVSYLRSDAGGNRNKIVLMGHSTGCQDTLRYLSKFMLESKSSKEIDGGILQAPVSDREGVAKMFDPAVFDGYVQRVYDEYITKGLGNSMLPLEFKKYSMGYNTTAYRFYSLYSKYGDDDFFSTYLTEEDLEKTFGKVTKPLLVLYGEKDEFALENVDFEQLIEKWKRTTKPGVWSSESKVLKDASHTVDDANAVVDLVETVARFVKSI